MLLSETDLASRIAGFLQEKDTVLFSGAGVGKRAGLPDWGEYVLELASAAEPYEVETADLMKKRWSEDLYGEAVRLFKACPKMPPGERLTKLAAPFRSDRARPSKLRALLSLPFSAAVTTNFDRSQHDAYSLATNKAPQVAELGDPSLKEAIYNWSSFFIARIHGRYEVPDTMVLTDEALTAVTQDSVYCDFLFHMLTRRSCLFLGFSFLDPAIDTILQVYADRAGPHFPELHLAILPKSSSRELNSVLLKRNIEVIQYEDDQNHSELWNGIRKGLSLIRARSPREERARPQPHELAKKILAVTFARHRLGADLEPLREVVVDGLVLGLLSKERRTSRAQVAGGLRAATGLTSSESSDIVDESLTRLLQRGWISDRGDSLQRSVELEDEIAGALEVLVKGVKERLLVRYGSEIRKSAERALTRVLEGLVLLHGWELGAEFSTGRGSDYFTIDRALDSLFKEHRARFHGFDPEPIRLATRDLLQRPSEKESQILNRLARVAFGIELAIERGVSVLTKRHLLPDRIYLDASVLLPAIATGHPLQRVYLDSLNSLAKASERTGTGYRVIVLEGFLNEVISHKKRAVRLVEESDLSNPYDLARFIDFVGAQNTNVFVGSYSSFVRRKGPEVVAEVTFVDYLDRFAPYETEEQLARFLESYKIDTVKAVEVARRIVRTEDTFLVSLREAYEEEAYPYTTSKHTVLIRHEARQLAILAADIQDGFKCIFITADSRLKRLVRGKTLNKVSESVFSRTAFVQLVDLVAGLSTRHEDSLARLLWAVEAGDGKGLLRGYLIDRGLREYDAALAMQLPKLAERIAAEISDAEASEIGQFDRVKSSSGARNALSLLDRYEERFFEGMAAEIRTLSAKEGEEK